MKLSDDQGPIQPAGPTAQSGGAMPRGGARLRRGDFEGNSIVIGNLVAALSQELGRPIIDKTDLKGRYDVGLQWTPESMPNLDSPTRPESVNPAGDLAQAPGRAQMRQQVSEIVPEKNDADWFE